ncbi:MAG: hypothetical protein PHE68_02785 [Candidatus Peribacteraceae bacterium]|nr:hypothetical protein [Candidatus Peribacteraceae bacterium]
MGNDKQPLRDTPEIRPAIPAVRIDSKEHDVRHQIGCVTNLAQVQRELLEGRESGEISREDFDFAAVREIYEVSGRVIQRCDLRDARGKERALVLSAADVESFRQIDYIGPHGESCTVDPESVRDVLILMPKHFGNGEWSEEG